MAAESATHHGSSSTSVLTPPAAAFRFVSRLAEELSKGRLELPALPEVVARIKQALADDNVAPAVIARLVATEPGLAARVMTLANSAVMNPSGAAITELRTAVTRVGFRNVRATSIAYAIAKLRQANEFAAIRGEMEALWRDALVVAAFAYCLAKRNGRINADEALLVGLVHNIGKVYILSRAHRYAQLFVGQEDAASIMRDWHANVGKAIVESWGFAPHLVQAIQDHEDAARDERQPDLADVLHVAVQAAPLMTDTQGGEQSIQVPPKLPASLPWLRLELNEALFQRTALDALQAVRSLQAALGN